MQERGDEGEGHIREPEATEVMEDFLRLPRVVEQTLLLVGGEGRGTLPGLYPDVVGL